MFKKQDMKRKCTFLNTYQGPKLRESHFSAKTQYGFGLKKCTYLTSKPLRLLIALYKANYVNLLLPAYYYSS